MQVRGGGIFPDGTGGREAGCRVQGSRGQAAWAAGSRRATQVMEASMRQGQDRRSRQASQACVGPSVIPVRATVPLAGGNTDASGSGA